MIKDQCIRCCVHNKSDLLNKSLKFNDKERNREGNVIIAEVDYIEVGGKTIAKCRHGDKSQQWFINEDFTTTKVGEYKLCPLCLDDIERDKYNTHLELVHGYECIDITPKVK